MEEAEHSVQAAAIIPAVTKNESPFHNQRRRPSKNRLGPDETGPAEDYQACISSANERRVNICLFVLYDTHTHGRAHLSVEAVSRMLSESLSRAAWPLGGRMKSPTTKGERERERESGDFSIYPPHSSVVLQAQWGGTLLSHLRNLTSSCEVGTVALG